MRPLHVRMAGSELHDTSPLHAKDTDIWIDVLRERVPMMASYIDVGAGDGHDCQQVKSAFPFARCIAVDPVEAWAEGIRVERHRDVIGFHGSPRTFHRVEAPGVHSLYKRSCFGALETTECKPIALDKFLRRRGLHAVDAMKLDAEGAAWDVLMGATNALRKLKALHVETEWLPLFDGQHLEPDVFKILESAGLERIWSNRVEDLGQGDSIWVRP